MNWKNFEATVHWIYEVLCDSDPNSEVTLDEKVMGHDGLRQCDVVVRTKVADFDILTVIECRNFQRRLSIEALDAFASKLVDINASKGIIVSKSGFTKTAKNKARRLGIDLYRLEDLTAETFDTGFNIPIIFQECYPTSASFELSLPPQAKDWLPHLQKDFKVSGYSFMDLYREAHQASNGGIVEGVYALNSLIAGTLELECALGRLPITSGSVTFEPNRVVYFGFLSNLPKALVKYDEIKESSVLFIEISDMNSVKNSLRKFSDFDRLPKYNSTSRFRLFGFPTSISAGKTSVAIA